MTAKENTKIAAIVLAAGQSKRMGAENKLLMDFAGKTVLRTTVENVLASRVSGIIVVTGHEAARVQKVLAGLAVSFVHNDRFATGMGTSISAGIASLGDDIDASLIVLADMPLVSPAVINRVISAVRPGVGAIVPVHNGREGNPVLWQRRYFDALMALDEDCGGRGLFKSHDVRPLRIEVGSDAIFADFDTPEELTSA